MMVAGSFLEIFTAAAVHAIHRFSGGIPSLINLICDHALMRAVSRGYGSSTANLLPGMQKKSARPLGWAAVISGLRPGVAEDQPGPFASEPILQVVSDGLRLGRDSVAGGGNSFCQFEKKPEVVVKSIFQAPVSLYFESGSTELSTRDSPSLDWIAEYLMQNPESWVTIKGYSDSKGTAVQNMRVSAAALKP